MKNMGVVKIAHLYVPKFHTLVPLTVINQTIILHIYSAVAFSCEPVKLPVRASAVMKMTHRLMKSHVAPVLLIHSHPPIANTEEQGKPAKNINEMNVVNIIK